MDTINERSGFLCNYEVLNLLKSQTEERDQRIAILKQIKLEKSTTSTTFRTREDEEMDRIKPPDLATINFEVIAYLENKVMPTARQSVTSIQKLIHDLESENLNVAEKLQIVNLVPQTIIEMVVCVDEFESRFRDESRDVMLALSRDSLLDPADVKGRSKTTYKAIEDDDQPEEYEEYEEEGDYEDGELVQEGLAGEGEHQGKELDED